MFRVFMGIQAIVYAFNNNPPNLVVCDEGHILSNNTTLLYKALIKVSTKRRIVLTGTPLQNNLSECNAYMASSNSW